MPDEPLPNPAENDDSSQRQVVTVERVLRLLEQGEVCEEHGRMRWSSNYTTIVSVKDEEIETLAVYKPQRGERPLWDFPDGTLCKREVAAFQVSDALGWDIVAPTVLREGPKGVGSIQLFVEHDPEITYFSLNDSFIPQLKTICAFDAIINNTDRKGGHCLVDPRGKLWGIDHGICFHVVPKLRTVIWDFAGQRIDNWILDDTQQVVDDLCNQGLLYEKLSVLLDNSEIEALKDRAKRLLQRKTFPHPGSGPNYPWPPV